MTLGSVRPVRAADLRRLADLEDSGLGLFEEHLADLTGDVLATPAISGGARLDAGGFILVVGDVGDPVGFAHVLDVEGHAHLEQLSVHPGSMRGGIGTALVGACLDEAQGLGHDRLSLCTYRDLPWNGPFYRRLGFEEVADLRPFHERIRAHERAAGLDRHGPRVVLERRC